MLFKRKVALKGFELKRKYQKNMLVGFVSAGMFFLMAFGLASGWNKEMPQPAFTVSDNIAPIFILPPPPGPPKKITTVDTGQPTKPPELGEIIPVSDDEAIEDSLITIFDEIINWVPEPAEFDPVEYASAENIERIIGSLLPGPRDFVAYDDQPVQIKSVLPVYPPMAKRAGVEGTVLVKALIDSEGRVRDVIIYKESGANAGFEEAATQAARKTVWKPAIANGQPVAVWVTYAVKFKLQ